MSKFGKYLLLATGFVFFATFARIPGSIINVHAQDHGCSVASLKGKYAFHLTGVNNELGGPIAEIGIDLFNGEGTRGVIRKTGSQNGEIVDWTDIQWPSGSYKVYPDCTGSFFDAAGTNAQNVIVLDGGKRFSVVGVLAATIISGEGVRLEEEKELTVR